MSVELGRNHSKGVQEVAHYVTSMLRVEHRSNRFGEEERDRCWIRICKRQASTWMFAVWPGLHVHARV